MPPAPGTDPSRGSVKVPARRVVYRSVTTRALRLAIGVALAICTLWIVLPVLGTDHGPPRPVALTLGTDAIDGSTPIREIPVRDRGIRASPAALYLTIHASGCTNPVTLEGQLIRSPGSWITERWGESAPPQQAIVTFAGARVREFAIGLDAIPGGKLITATGQTDAENDPVDVVQVHNKSLPLIHTGNTTTAVLDARQWPQARTPLGFVIKADLMSSAGFHSCYIALPELFETGSNSDHRAFYHAAEAFEYATQHVTALAHPPHEVEPAGVGPEEIGAAQIRLMVDGRSVAPGSIGEGGEQTSTGVRYVCHTRPGTPRPVPGIDQSISPEPQETGNPDCSGTPLFQAVDVSSDTTRRLFFAGIIGALAATLIVEALFLGETAPTEDPPTAVKRDG
jgi:hypothetical protein